jgi:2-polyprenyl-3-methyl-5-hydroxy-6-metoxy-1,4-benzoquinol methylase
MIEIAKKNIKDSLINNIKFEHYTIFDKNYEESAFDVIMVLYILHLIDNTKEVMERLSKLLKPGGLIISATPCMGENKFILNFLLFLGNKMGLIPKVQSIKISELKGLIISLNFEIVKYICLDKWNQEYFIVAKKL